MSRRPGFAAAVAVLLTGAGIAASAADLADAARRSGFDFMSPSTQAMQRDDAQNPGMLWVGEGEASWVRKSGTAEVSCANCHGAATVAMRGVAAHYPAFDNLLQRPVNLGERINLCRQRHQQAVRLAPESPELLGLESFVAFHSRGFALARHDDPRLAPFQQRGRRLFEQRIGQLDLSCAQCHDGHAGQHLGGSVIPQAHPTAYPVYRLEWQALGSLQRRLRNCMTGVRAEPYAYGAPELVELELHLAARAAGMTVESPGVRP